MTRKFIGEQVIQLKRATTLPCFYARPSYRALWKWARYGIKGIRLETGKQGRNIFTSVEAVERFMTATEKASKLREHNNGRS